MNLTDVGLRIGNLSREGLHLRVFEEDSFSTNEDLSSKLIFMVILCDHRNPCHIMDYASRNSQRFVR